MLERLQSALKSVKDSKPSSMLSHRFVTVRRGSPAARSGHIQPGDQLEAVEGRSVVSLPHRDLAQLLRRAGNTLRLTIIPRPTTKPSSLPEGPETDTDGRTRKAHRGRLKQLDQRFYTVDLERGPTGFGFSLRGGSEYNMGLYVLGLMEGGPASRSHRIQVSDQLVEINGDSTTGMTHSQAVEQIRRGGHRIHLVLKKGNGYVPDYDHDPRATSPSFPPDREEPGMTALDKTQPLPSESGKVDSVGDGGERRGRQGKGGSLGGGRARGGTGGGERRGRQGEGVSLGGGRARGGSGVGSPDTDLDWPEERMSHKGQRLGYNKKQTQSLLKDTVRCQDREEEETERSRTWQRSKQPRGRERRWSVDRLEDREVQGQSASRSQVRIGGSGGGRREKVRETEAGRPVMADSPPDVEKAPFSFLMPLQDGGSELSESSGDSTSAASLCGTTTGAPSGWRDPKDHREDTWSTQAWRHTVHTSHTPESWRSTQPRGASPNLGAPVLWIKPSQQKLSQVLAGPKIRAGLDL